MKATAKKVGRKKGGSNKAGFYFLNTTTRKGWYTSGAGGKIVPLRDQNGNHIKDRGASKAAQEAYARQLLARQQEEERGLVGDKMPLMEIIWKYLGTIEGQTHEVRRRFLYDFCTGYPGRFLNADKAGEKKPVDRIHEGYGPKPVLTLIPNDVREWVQAHKNWSLQGGGRTGIQALKRALNWAVEMGLISKNPIRGFKVKSGRRRLTYFTAEQEATLIENASPALAQAIAVLIRTGARYGCEFAKLTDRHVIDDGKRMLWKFEAKESKTRKRDRIIFVPPEVADIVRQQLVKIGGKGRVFRNEEGTPWTQPALRKAFYRLCERIEGKIDLDADACLYTTRHTYAKRMLTGYWSGKPMTIEYLCKLMGNTMKVCWDTYGQWADSYQEPLWEAIEGTK